ncbi:MAG: hypothetical protein WBV59_22005, partial [Anaerolineae bacterium]
HWKISKAKIKVTIQVPCADYSRRMNSGRKGVPPPGRPAPTSIASTQVDARRYAHQARFQSLLQQRTG